MIYSVRRIFVCCNLLEFIFSPMSTYGKLLEIYSRVFIALLHCDHVSLLQIVINCIQFMVLDYQAVDTFLSSS